MPFESLYVQVFTHFTKLLQHFKKIWRCTSASTFIHIIFSFFQPSVLFSRLTCRQHLLAGPPAIDTASFGVITQLISSPLEAESLIVNNEAWVLLHCTIINPSSESQRHKQNQPFLMDLVLISFISLALVSPPASRKILGDSYYYWSRIFARKCKKSQQRCVVELRFSRVLFPHRSAQCERMLLWFNWEIDVAKESE